MERWTICVIVSDQEGCLDKLCPSVKGLDSLQQICSSFVLMKQKKPIVTLGQAYEAGWRVNVRCNHGPMRGMKRTAPCMERSELDMETLIWTRGEGFLLENLGSRMKCPNCWSRRIFVLFNERGNVQRYKRVTPQ